MDARNLAIVVGPNLVKSSNPIRDVQICSVAGGSTDGTTLGTVLVLCISRYYECFEELHDRAEALSPTKSNDSLTRSEQDADWAVVSNASGTWTARALGASGHTTLAHDENAFGIGDDEDDDDAHDDMGAPPSAWSSAGVNGAFKPRHRSTASRGSGSRLSSASASVRTGGSSTPGTMRGRARSTVSVDKGSGTLRGSISVGTRGTGGTMRGKTPGAGVEAISITAAGFFTAPDDAPTVPASHIKSTRNVTNST
jgi:Rho GTPase-activating protein 1